MSAVTKLQKTRRPHRVTRSRRRAEGRARSRRTRLPQPPTLRVFFDDYEWWVARSLREAMRLQRKFTGIEPAEQQPAEDWAECRPTSSVRWYREDGTYERVTFDHLARRSGIGLAGGTEY